MAHKRFLLLLSLNKESAAYGKGMLARIQRDVDANAAPHWIDSRGIGVFISSPRTIREIWTLAIPTQLSPEERRAFQDMLILQIGKETLGFPETRAVAWLNSHPHAD